MKFDCKIKRTKGNEFEVYSDDRTKDTNKMCNLTRASDLLPIGIQFFSRATTLYANTLLNHEKTTN